MIVLDDGRARAEVHPEAGAAIGRYDLSGTDGSVLPIFETDVSKTRSGPFALALNLLVPFSNRISGGGFTHAGTFHPLERNTAGPFPIHGNGFMLPWRVADTTDVAARLTLSSDGPGPFRYDAEVVYALSGGALTTRLMIVNRADRSLPYGAGLHPWFVRTPATRLTMRADGYWTETADHLPDTYQATAGDPRFDFASGALLPDGLINNALTGWDGHAVLTWPDRGLGVTISADPPLSTLILYSPSQDAGFVCIEPVSHSIDAHNRRDHGSAPPQILDPGAALTIETTFTPYLLAP